MAAENENLIFLSKTQLGKHIGSFICSRLTRIIKNDRFIPKRDFISFSNCDKMIYIIFYFIIILLLWNFSHQLSLAVFHWSLSDSKSSKIFRTPFSILPDFNSTVLWIVTILPLVSSSPSVLWTVPRASTTVCITVKFMFRNFFSFLERSNISPVFLLLFFLWSKYTKIHEITCSFFVN